MQVQTMLVGLAVLVAGCQGVSGAGDEGDDGVIPNVVIIGWDGVQWDHLQQCRAGELAECPRLPSSK